AELCHPLVGIFTNDDKLGGRHRRRWKRMRAGEGAAREVDVRRPLLDAAGRDRPVQPGGQAVKVDVRQLDGRQAPPEPGHVLVLQPATALIEAKDLVNGIAEEKSPIPDRNPGLVDRHQLAIETRQTLHYPPPPPTRCAFVASRQSSYPAG